MNLPFFDSEAPVTVRNTGLRYGIILGLVSIAYFLLLVISGVNTTDGWGRWSSLLLNAGILALGQIYFRQNGDGYMSYGQGMSISFWTGALSSLILSVFTYVYIKFIDSDFLLMMEDIQRAAMEERGMSDEQIDQAMEMVSKFSTPEWIFGFGVIGGIIGVLLVGLLVTIFTQKPNRSMPE